MTKIDFWHFQSLTPNKREWWILWTVFGPETKRTYWRKKKPDVTKKLVNQANIFITITVFTTQWIIQMKPFKFMIKLEPFWKMKIKKKVQTELGRKCRNCRGPSIMLRLFSIQLPATSLIKIWKLKISTRKMKELRMINLKMAKLRSMIRKERFHPGKSRCYPSTKLKRLIWICSLIIWRRAILA